MTASAKKISKPATADLIPLRDVEKVPGWPFSHWHTGRLIRDGKLSSIAMGRRVFVTKAILDEYVARHEVKASND